MARLEATIAEKEARLLHGGQILDAAAKQREALTHAERELAERLAADERLRQELLAAEQNEAYMKQQYVSQEQELEIKTAKLKQLWAAYKQREQELSELQVQSCRISLYLSFVVLISMCVCLIVGRTSSPRSVKSSWIT